MSSDGSESNSSFEEGPFRPCEEPLLARELAEGEDEGLPDEYKILAKETFDETEEKRKETIQKLRHWAAENYGPSMPKRTPFLSIFARKCKLNKSKDYYFFVKYRAV